jgi:hypothetical protein
MPTAGGHHLDGRLRGACALATACAVDTQAQPVEAAVSLIAATAAAWVVHSACASARSVHSPARRSAAIA